MQVFVGNGSDEVLAHAFHGPAQARAPLLFPDITYSFYPVYCGLYGIDFETVPLAERLRDPRGRLPRRRRGRTAA
jgi:histidinol-phosphate aminotransferase